MNMMEITIRSIQHYLYCPHRWGLIEIDKAWAENFFVTKANLMHDRVHDPNRHYTTKGKRVFTSVSVYNALLSALWNYRLSGSKRGQVGDSASESRRQV